MDSFAPEFSRFWLPAKETDAQAAARERAEDEARQQAALAELAERVTAARTIV